MNQNLLEALKGKLIVSCQALSDEPLHSSLIMGRMAYAAKVGGASGIRANTIEDIAEIKKNVDLPVIGIIKIDYSDSEIYITPTMKEINKLIQSPAEIIAMDATKRKRPGNADLGEMVKAVKRSGKFAMADISNYEEGVQAEKLGFDLVSTTLSGYTSYTPPRETPDFELIRKLSSSLHIPVVAEGHIATPHQMLECFSCGAYFTVIGSAITRPQLITRFFVDALESGAKNSGK